MGNNKERQNTIEFLNNLSLLFVPGILALIGYYAEGGYGVIAGLILGLGINLWRERSVLKDLFP